MIRLAVRDVADLWFRCFPTKLSASLGHSSIYSFSKHCYNIILKQETGIT